MLQVDPLFHKTSAAFDEGGVKGLLLNHLSVRDDTCELLLDSTAVIAPQNTTTLAQSQQQKSMVDLSEYRGNYPLHIGLPNLLKVNFMILQAAKHGENISLVWHVRL